MVGPALTPGVCTTFESPCPTLLPFSRLGPRRAGRRSRTRTRAVSVTGHVPEPVPQPHQPSGRDDDDGEEDEPDDGVEAPTEDRHRDVADVVVDDDEGEGTEPCALD